MSISTRRARSVVFALVLLLTTGAGSKKPLEAQPVLVSVGVPTLWTLEQAHYLLARQRAGNLTLEGRRLTPDDLDPNAVHSSRLTALRTLFGLEVAYDQTVGEENRMALQHSRDVQDTRTALTTRLEELRSQQLNTLKQVGELKVDAARLSPETQKTDRAVKDAEIASKELEVKFIEDRIAETKDLLSKVTDAPADLKATTLGQTWAMGSGALSTELAKKAVDGMSGPPKLHASMMLDNYIQMQYEPIAKQLSLLRDDLGAENRLVFLELPASVYTTPSSGQDKLVEAAWRIHSYVECPAPAAVESYMGKDLQEAETRLRNVCGGSSAAGTTKNQQSAPLRAFSRSDVLQLLPPNEQRKPAQYENAKPWLTERKVTTADEVRIVDLFPRQAALNVNQAHDQVNKVSISALWSAIGGFGAKTQYERQRELFEHYIQQDIFAAGYGKGLARFAWTFGPLPGSRQVAPGIKTTYAAVVVPSTARAIVLKGRGCWFKRKETPPDAFAISDRTEQLCEAEREFVLKVSGATENQPEDLEGFDVREIEYRAAQAGEITTLILKGTFSPQVGVLIDGMPLRRQIGLGQLELNGGTLTFDGDRRTVQGEFEYVNQRIVAIRFATTRTFEGIPRITLVTPQRVGDINGQPVDRINNVSTSTCPVAAPNCLTLDSVRASHPVFHTPLSLAGLQILSVNKQAATVTGHVTGTGFLTGLSLAVTLNGAAVATQISSSTFLKADFAVSDAPTWVLIATRSTTAGSESVQLAIENPLLAELDKATVVSVVKATSSLKERVIVQMTGGVFTKNLDTFAANGATLVPGGVTVAPKAVLVEVEGPQDTFEIRWARVIGSITQGKVWTIAREKEAAGNWVVK